MSKRIDMTGWKMCEHGVPASRIIVIKFDSIKNNEAHWECLCECGTIFVTSGSRIRNGQTLSCGCLHKEKRKKHAKLLGSIYGGYNKKQNTYDLTEDFAIGYFSDGTQFYFDIEDYDKIKDYYWYNNHGYVGTRKYRNNRFEYIYMHRLIMNAEPDDIVDHINRNKLDNRKLNLRTTNDSGNAMNTSIAKNNTSGVIGVLFVNNRNVWMAQITVNYQNIHLGCFINKDDAIKSRLQAEAKYYGEFAPQRHLFEKYGITQLIEE